MSMLAALSARGAALAHTLEHEITQLHQVRDGHGAGLRDRQGDAGRLHLSP